MAVPIGRRGVWLVAVLALLGALVLLRDRWMWILPFGDPGPPPGRLVDVGGFRLHLVCEGEGSPTVVLDAGSADAWLTWFKVQPALAKVTRVCSYDRAGIGYSDPGPQPRSRRRIVEELRTLLHRAGIPPPYVLAGLVLSAGKRQRPPDRSPELHDRWVRIAAELQDDLAARSPRSRHVTVEGAGHLIHWDRPDVVIREVTTLVSRLPAKPERGMT